MVQLSPENSYAEDSGGEEELTLEEEESLNLVESANKSLEELEDKEDVIWNLEDEQLQKILDQFESALTLDASNLDAYLGKAYLYGLTEDFDKGDAVLQEAKLIAPADPRITEMIEELSKMKEENPKEEQEEEADNTEVKEEAKKDVPLLVKDGVMTKEFYEVLVKIFHFFDEDGDGAWNSKELNTFYQTVNEVAIDKNTVLFLSQHFHKNSKGFITQKGFLEFYLSQTAGGVEETWKDLENLGFGKDLKEVDERYAKIQLVQTLSSNYKQIPRKM